MLNHCDIRAWIHLVSNTWNRIIEQGYLRHQILEWASKIIGLKKSSLQWWLVRRYILFQSLYCECEGIGVYKYSSLITWDSSIDRNNTWLGSILYVKNYIQKSELALIKALKQTVCNHMLASPSLFGARASPGLCPLPLPSFMKGLNPGWSSPGSVPGLPILPLCEIWNKWLINGCTMIY